MIYLGVFLLKEKYRIFDLEKFTVENSPKGWLHVVFKSNTKINLEDAIGVVKYEGILSRGQKRPILHVVEEFVDFDNEVMRYSAGPGTQFSSAEAYVIKSVAHRIVGNFYMRVSKPKVPTKVFNSIEKAEEWLSQFVKPDFNLN